MIAFKYVAQVDSNRKSSGTHSSSKWVDLHFISIDRRPRVYTLVLIRMANGSYRIWSKTCGTCSRRRPSPRRRTRTSRISGTSPVLRAWRASWITSLRKQKYKKKNQPNISHSWWDRQHIKPSHCRDFAKYTTFWQFLFKYSSRMRRSRWWRWREIWLHDSRDEKYSAGKRCCPKR